MKKNSNIARAAFVRTTLVTCAAGALFAALFSGCKEKQTAVSVAPKAVEARAPLAKATKQTAVALYTDKDGAGTPLYKENEEGKMLWFDEALYGDTITLYCLNNEPVQKNAIRRLYNGTEEAMDFVQVSYYGTDCWTRPQFITSQKNVIPAVATSDTYIYSSTDLVNAKTTKITAGTIFAVGDAITVDEIRFSQVFYYDWNTPFGKEGYVKTEAISANGSDVTATQTLAALARTKDLKPQVRKAVYEKLSALDTSISIASPDDL